MKTIVLLLVAIILIAPLYTYAQAPDTLWTRNYGIAGFAEDDEAWQLKQTPDGGFIIVGSSDTYDDIYLLKTDENGDTLWTSLLGFASDDVGRSVEPLDDGGYIITGYAGGYIVLMKTDSLGNHLWHHYLGNGWGRAVRVTSDGNFIVAGYTLVIDSSFQVYLAKTDAEGDIIWSKTYGGTNPERAWDLQETADGGYVVVGWTESYGLGNSDIYLIKTDANGDSTWTRTYGGISADEGRSIIVKEDGGYVIGGKVSNRKAIINTDQNGDTLWTRIYLDDNTNIANSVIETFDGNYILAGMILSPAYMYSSFVMKINSDGDSLWSKRIYDPDRNLYCRSIIQTEDNGFVFAGYHQMPNLGNEVFLCKLAPEIVGIEDDIAVLPENITLRQNYPNPFNANTTISFTLPEPANISLSIYDLLGRKIAVLADGYFNSGVHDMNFDAEDLSSGIYFYNLKVGDISESKSMILLK